MGWRYSLSLSDAGFRQIWDRLGYYTRDLRAPMEEIGAMLQTATDLRFERQVDPDGNPWTALSTATVKEKEKSGFDQILQRHGHLRRSITRKVGMNSVVLGTNLSYAAIHQFGGVIQKHAQSREIYRKLLKSGEFATNRTGLPTFVKRSKSNFATWHQVDAHRVVIPARPFLGISLADRAAALRILKQHLLQGVPA